MMPLQRALIEKAGHDHGFEHVLPGGSGMVSLGSARHPARVVVTVHPNGYALEVLQGPATLMPELDRSFAQWPRNGAAFLVNTDADLALWLRRASALAQALPNQAVVDFDTQVQQALAALPVADTQSTEVQRLVRQRVGQDRYRQAMLSYWGGACAVTGLTVQTALRASHAKPWAACQYDAERLDVFNGFLLSANLDALFDKYLISFTSTGELLIHSSLTNDDRKALGLADGLRLRWIAPEHMNFLQYHREKFDEL